MRDVTKLGLRLFIFTLIAALALAVTNEITSGPIAQQELAAGQAAQGAADTGASQQQGPNDDGVVDADFKEV